MHEKLRPVLVGRSVCGLVLAAALLAANGAAAEIIKKQDLLHGITITHAQCEATSQTLWLSAFGRDFCVRYYLSTAGGEGPRPVVFLQGDQLGKLNPKARTWIDTSEAKDVDTDDLVRIADGFSKMTKTTAIYLARIGVDGTSGDHMSRKTVLELQLMNAALDAIKRRHGFEGFHLAGQSGGSVIADGLTGLRRDISCAVLGSGQYLSPQAANAADPARSYLDTAKSIPELAQNHSMRPFLVTDRMDKKAPVAQQSGYIDKVRRAGRQIPQLFVEATDDNHHGVLVYTRIGHGRVRSRPIGRRNRPCGEHHRQAQHRIQQTKAQGDRRQGEHRGRRATGRARFRSRTRPQLDRASGCMDRAWTPPPQDGGHRCASSCGQR